MPEERKHSHYFRPFPYENIDIYRFLEVFDVTCPVAQHIIKKAVASGKRGHKDLQRDWQDIVDSAQRKLEMLRENDDAWYYAKVDELSANVLKSAASPLHEHNPVGPGCDAFDDNDTDYQLPKTLRAAGPWYPQEPAGLEWKETQWERPQELGDYDEVYVLYRHERNSELPINLTAEPVRNFNWDNDGFDFDVVAYAVKKD